MLSFCMVSSLSCSIGRQTACIKLGQPCVSGVLNSMGLVAIVLEI